jgi:hypothetical protein
VDKAPLEAEAGTGIRDEEGEKRRVNKDNRCCKPQRRRDDARAIGRLFA